MASSGFSDSPEAGSPAAAGEASAAAKKPRSWLYRQLRVAIPVIVAAVVIQQIVAHSNVVPASPPKQLAALITKTVEEQLHKSIGIGSDPAATHISSDCNETSKTAQQTNYTCFAYLSAPASRSEVQQWQGRITAAGGMKAHLVTASGSEILNRGGGSSAATEEGGP